MQLRTARTTAGLTQTQLSVAAGVGEATVRRIETGRTTPSEATMARLAEALGVPVGDLDGAHASDGTEPAEGTREASAA